MRPSELANDPKLAADLIAIFEANCAWVAAEERVEVLGEAMDQRDEITGELLRVGLKSDSALWPQMNTAYTRQTEALKVMRARTVELRRKRRKA